jgi:hypothetical protein
MFIHANIEQTNKHFFEPSFSNRYGSVNINAGANAVATDSKGIVFAAGYMRGRNFSDFVVLSLSEGNTLAWEKR